MQDIHGFSELGDIEDSMGRSRTNPYFVHSQAYARHRFPIARIQPLLDPSQLVTDFSPGLRRKLPDEFEAIASQTICFMAALYWFRDNWQRRMGGCVVRGKGVISEQ